MEYDARLRSLLQRRSKLISIKRSMDKNAPLDSEEGFGYAKVLTTLTLVNLEIEEMHEKKATLVK